MKVLTPFSLHLRKIVKGLGKFSEYRCIYQSENKLLIFVYLV